MDRAGPAAGLVGPRHAALDREVDLEGARPVAVAAVGAGDPAREPVAGDLGDSAGARSKTTTSGAPSSASERTRTPVSILPPCSRAPRRARR